MSAVRALGRRVVDPERVYALQGRAAVALARWRERRHAPDAAPAIRGAGLGFVDDVEAYWSDYTVLAKPFLTARGSLRHLDWRFREYPLFRELSGLHEVPRGATVLDYGCGPGNDLVGFATRSDARRIVGADVSPTALLLARDRLRLHGAPARRVELVRLQEGHERLALADASVDFVSSQGVLHHASDPGPVLAELARVMRPGATGSVMVYNRDSIWLHLVVAWERRVRDGVDSDRSLDDAFRRSTDGEGCPIARCHSAPEWIALCEAAGLEAEYVGGYLTRPELRGLRGSRASAIADDRLEAEHRSFLRGLTFDRAGLPMHAGSYAGLGGTYRVRRPG